MVLADGSFVVASAEANAAPTGLQWYWKADFFKELSDAAIAKHLEHAALPPTWQSGMHLYPANGRRRDAEVASKENRERWRSRSPFADMQIEAEVIAARSGADATGIDIAENLVERSRERARVEGLSARFHEADAEDLPLADATFDVVTSRAREAITELVVAIENGLKLMDLAVTIHAYPAYSTALQQLATDFAIDRTMSGAAGKIIRRFLKFRR